MEAVTYRGIKASLAWRAAPPGQAAVDRLRAFGTVLASGAGDKDESGHAPPP